MDHPLRRPELLVCAWRGHAIPGALVDPLDERHHVLARESVDGRRVVQCLRCRGWVITEAPGADSAVALESPAHIEHPRRGHALREAIVMRIIAIDRAAHAVAFGAVAVAALAVRWKLTAIHGWAAGILHALSSADRGQGGASSHGLVAALLTRLANVRPSSLLALAAFAAVYALVSTFEAVGLWRERRWAEYLTALATAGFLPIEVHELVDRVTFVRVGAMVVNLAILAYLVFTKHLFGVRGPILHAPPDDLEPLPELLPPRPREGSVAR
jgi:uncharacterized membrane protein (DUF2068 family)